MQLSLCYRPSTNTSFCTESKECLEYELVCKTDEYEVGGWPVKQHIYFPIKLFTSLTVLFTYFRVCVCVCSFRCDTTAPLAGCRQTLKPTSWAWVQPWPSGDFSSTSLEPMKEVRTGQKQKISPQECVIQINCIYIAAIKKNRSRSRPY